MGPFMCVSTKNTALDHRDPDNFRGSSMCVEILEKTPFVG